MKLLWQIAFLLFLAPTVGTCQVDFKQYESLLSEGRLPPDALSMLHLNPESSLGHRTDYTFYRDEKVAYLRHVQYAIEELFSQGLVLFNDTLSRHANHVAHKLIYRNPTLLSELRFYVIKSPAVNSFVTESGMAFLTIGLIANCQNEAQLAWAISRLIIHYIHQHKLQSHEVFVAVTDEAGPLPLEQRLMARRLYAGPDQVHADTASLAICSRAGYDVSDAESGIDVLGNIYAPYEDLYFTPAFLENEYLRIPPEMLTYIIKDMQPPDKPEGHISRFAPPEARKLAIKITTHRFRNIRGKSNLISESGFAYINKIARYESCLLYLAHHKFCRALYQAYLLSLSDFNNPFLERVQLRALYGLAIYASEDSSRAQVPDPEESTGQITQVFHLFHSLSNAELLALAIHAAANYQAYHTEDELINKYLEHLGMLLNQNHHWYRDDAAAMTPDARPIDFADSLGITEVALAAMQAHSDNQKLLEAFPRRVQNTQRPRRKRLFAKKIRPRTYPTGTVHYLPLTYSLVDMRKKDKLLSDISFREQQKLRVNMYSYLDTLGASTDLLEPSLLERESVNSYNRLTQLTMWMQERGMSPDLQPIVPELLNPLNLESPLVGRINVNGLREHRKNRGYILAGSAVLTPFLPAGVYYMFSPYSTLTFKTQVWDTRTGQAVFVKQTKIVGNWWRRNLIQTNLYQELNHITNLRLSSK